MSTNLNLDVVTTGQTAKEATINAAFAELDSKLTATLSIAAYTGPTLSQLQRNGVILYTGVAAATSITFPGTFTGMVIIRSDAANTHAAHLVCGSATYDLDIGTSALLMFDGTTNGMFVLAGGGGGGGGSTLAALTDVNVTEGSGIDGFSLTWDNATTKWIATNVSGGGGGGGGSTPTGYKLVVNSIASGSVVTMGEIEFSLAGSPITITSILTSSDFDPSGQPKSNLDDGNINTWWGAASGGLPASITFGVAGTIDELTITPRQSGFENQAPTAFDLYVTYDGTLFQLITSYTHSWSGGSAVNFSVTGIPPKPSIAHLHDLLDVNVTEGSGIDKYLLKWDNATSKWIAISPLQAVEAALAAAPTSAPGGGAHLWINSGVVTYS